MCMGQSDSRDDSTDGRRRKVVRLLDEYGLEGLGVDLEERWTAEDERLSLRELADYFNRQLLRQAMLDAGVQTVDGNVENIYRLLTDDAVSDAEQTRVRRRLEREGLDVETLQTDFVSYGAIRTYLKEYRGADHTSEDVDPIEREITNIEQLRGRVESVAEGKLEQLQSAGQVDLDEFRMLVEIQVVCEECNTQYGFVELLERGGCECPHG
jgi:hypothetical protein